MLAEGVVLAGVIAGCPVFPASNPWNQRVDQLPVARDSARIIADNGSDWYITGAPHPRWSNDQLHTLKRVRGSDFEVVAQKGP